MGKKWSSYKVSDKTSKWDKFKAIESNSIEIPESSRIAYEHNNPGNLMYVGQEGAEKGEPKEGGGYWAKFENPEAGYMGLVKDIQAKQSGKTASNLSGSSTLKELIGVYAPSTENDTQGYVKNIARKLGVKEDTPIKDIDAASIAKNIANIESGTKVGAEAVIPPNTKAGIEEKDIDYSIYNDIYTTAQDAVKGNYGAEDQIAFLNEVSQKWKELPSADGLIEKTVESVSGNIGQKVGDKVLFNPVTGNKVLPIGDKLYEAPGPSEYIGRPPASDYISQSIFTNALIPKLTARLIGLGDEINGYEVKYSDDPEGRYTESASMQQSLAELGKARDPNLIEKVGSFALSMTVDAPLFGIFGKAGQLGYRGTSFLLSKAGDMLVKTGLGKLIPRVGASTAGIFQKFAQSAAQSGGALGLYNAASDIENQIEQGKSIEEIDYKNTVNAGGHGLILGTATAPLALISKYANQLLSNQINKSISGALRPIAEKGTALTLATTSLGAEAGIFAYGGAFISGGPMPTTEEYLQTVAEFGALKLGHALSGKGFELKPELKPEDIVFTDMELKKAGYASKEGLLADAKNEGNFKKIFADKNIPFTAKKKVAAYMGVDIDVIIDPYETRAVEKDGKYSVQAIDKDGNILEEVPAKTYNEAVEQATIVAKSIDMRETLRRFNALSPKNKMDIDANLVFEINALLDSKPTKDFTQEEWSKISALNKDVNKLFTVEDVQLADKNVFPIEREKIDYLKERKVEVGKETKIEEVDNLYKTEKKSEKSEKKLTETVNKKEESEKKLTETKAQTSEKEATKESKTKESLPNVEASAEASAEKIKEKEVKDAEENGTGTQKGGKEKGNVKGEGESIRVRNDEKGRMEAEKGTESKAAEEVILDNVYGDFIDNGIVSDNILSSIANKVMSRKELSLREQAIFADKTKEIEAKIKEYKNGKLNDGNGRDVSSGRGQEEKVREGKRTAQEQNEKITTEPAEGKTEPGVSEENPTVPEKGKKVSESKNVEISGGKLKSKNNLLKEISSSVTKRIAKRKSNEIIRAQQKLLDKDMSEFVPSEIDKIERQGIVVDFTKRGEKQTKRYSVKKQKDGTYAVSDMHNRKADGSARPLSKAEVSLKKEIIKEYRKRRMSELAQIKNAVEERHLEELNKKLEREVGKYVSKREKEATPVPESFSTKEPTQKTRPSEGKKQPSRMEEKSEEITMKEAELRNNQIRMEAKAASEAVKNAKAEYSKVSDEIRQQLKDSKDKNYIRPQKFQSIIRKLDEAVGGTLKKQQEALDYVYKVLGDVEGMTERTDTIARINKILDKKRTETRFGQRRMRKNKPLMRKGEIITDKNGNPVLSKTGVDPEEKMYFEESKKHFKRAMEFDKLSKRIKTLNEQEKLTDEQIKRLSEYQEKWVNMMDELSNDVRETEILIGTTKSNSVRDRAKMKLLAIDDMKDITSLSNENLGDLLNVLESRQDAGAEKLNKSVENSIKKYIEISGIVEKATAAYGIGTEEFNAKAQRRKSFRSKKQEAIKINNTVNNKFKWWLKELNEDSVSDKEKLLKNIMSDNFHLETTMKFLDMSENSVLANYVVDKIAKQHSQKLRDQDLSENTVFGKAIEIFNKKFADELREEYGNPETDNIAQWISENKKWKITPGKIAIPDQLRVANAFQEIYNKWLENITKKPITITQNGIKTQAWFSEADMMKFYAWHKDAKISEELSAAGMKKEIVDDFVSKEAKEFVDYVVDDFMNIRHNQADEVNRKVNRVALSKRESYLTLEREKLFKELGLGKTYISDDINDVKYGFLIDRVQNNNPIRIISTDNFPSRNFVEILNKYINDTGDFITWAEASKDFDVILNHPDFKSAADAIGLQGLIKKQIDVNVNGERKVRNDYINTVIGKNISKYANVALAFKVNMIAKQYASVGNALADAESAKGWAREYLKLMNSPKETAALYQELYNESPPLKERVDNAMKSDPDLRGARVGFGTKNIRKTKETAPTVTRKKWLWKQISNGYIPYGDQMAIVHGYGALYRLVLKETGSKEKALQAFEKYESTQQSRSNLYLSLGQTKRDGLHRTIMMFKSSPLLYANKSFQALVDMKRDIKRGGIGNIKKSDARKFIINYWVSNILFQAIGGLPDLLMGNTDDYRKKIDRAFLLGPLNGLFFIGDIIQWGTGKIWLKEKYSLQIFKPIEDLIEKPVNVLTSGMEKKDAKKVLWSAVMFSSYMQGLPIHTVLSIYEGLSEIGNGDITSGFLKSMGYTKYSVDEAKKTKSNREDERDSLKNPYNYELDLYNEEAKDKWGWGKDENDKKENPFNY
jgi:hypothetical protein